MTSIDMDICLVASTAIVMKVTTFPLILSIYTVIPYVGHTVYTLLHPVPEQAPTFINPESFKWRGTEELVSFTPFL
jgi:hypothetical protein